MSLSSVPSSDNATVAPVVEMDPEEWVETLLLIDRDGVDEKEGDDEESSSRGI